MLTNWSQIGNEFVTQPEQNRVVSTLARIQHRYPVFVAGRPRPQLRLPDSDDGWRTATLVNVAASTVFSLVAIAAGAGLLGVFVLLMTALIAAASFLTDVP